MLIDSNIIVYAINADSAKHETAKDFLRAHKDELYIAHQNVTESLRVLTHPKFSSPMNVPDALEAISRITDVCKVIAPGYNTYAIALELISQHSLRGDAVFDAYLAATAIEAEVVVIATDNVKDFRRFQQLTVINPFSKL